jgi:hypothetical protein
MAVSSSTTISLTNIRKFLPGLPAQAFHLPLHPDIVLVA